LRAVIAAAALCACGSEAGSGERLRVPQSAPTKPVTLGLQALKLGGARDGVLYIPTTYVESEPLPLVVLLHGAGGDADNWFGSYAQRAEDARVVLLAPDSRGITWDAIRGKFGEDVSFINAALELVASEVAIDRTRMALAGFSDGATYSLSLGLANGDLFTHVIAYSPGFIVSSTNRGTPKFFISHGKQDTILPIARTSREIVSVFRSRGYDVHYVEFDGGHEVPLDISTQAFSWLKADWSPPP
jgi:phospholipase/carboxylesterase